MDQKVKDIIEKAKATAVNAAAATGKVADSASKKASGIIEITKLNFQIFDMNTDIELLFKEIGKCVYLTHTGAEVDADEITNKIAEIDEKYQKIAEMKKQINEKKEQVKCAACGKECDKDDAFCRSCGSPL